MRPISTGARIFTTFLLGIVSRWVIPRPMSSAKISPLLEVSKDSGHVVVVSYSPTFFFPAVYIYIVT